MNGFLLFYIFIAIFCIFTTKVSGFRSLLSFKRGCSVIVNSLGLIDCDIGEFSSDVLESKDPVIVDFKANWCGPCKLTAPIFKALSNEYEGPVKFVIVDTDVHEELVQKYNIQGLPLFALFINGEVVATHSGGIGKDALRKFIDTNLPAKLV